jgi:hypothetical protein
MGLLDRPYRETGMRGFGLYPWRAFCLSGSIHMEIREANKILIDMLDILPGGKFKGIYPLNREDFLPASKEKIKEAVKTYIDFHKQKNRKIAQSKRDELLKIYVALASYINKKDFEMVMKLNLVIGNLYTVENEEVPAWFSSPKNRREYERSNEITGAVMLEAKQLKQEIEALMS